MTYKTMDGVLYNDSPNFLGRYTKRSDLYNAVTEVSYHSFYDWARRNSIPSADIAVKIAKYLNTSVEYLITGIEPDKETKIPDVLQALINKYAEK